MFVVLSVVSLLLFFILALFQKTAKYSISVYLIVFLVLSYFYLEKSNEKGVALTAAHISKSIDPGYLTIPDLALSQNDLRKMSSFDSYDDAIKTRADLIRFIWKQNTLPLDAMPDSIEKNIKIPERGEFSNLARADSIEIRMQYGFTSTAYHFLPEKGNGRLFIYHQGHHSGGFLKGGMKVIARLVNEGYAVLAFSMPATGMNKSPKKVEIGKQVWEDRDDLNPVQVHESYKSLEQPTFSPLKIFLHPVVVGLNYALATYDYERVSMTGLSGGAWTTSISAALDTRIHSSYPVAGSMPLYLLQIFPNNTTAKGFEYSHPAFMDVGYLKLYVLGALGKNRFQRQIFNQFDKCCSRGVAAYTYAPHVSEGVAKLGVGGDYKLAIIPQQKHAISKATFAIILRDEGSLD